MHQVLCELPEALCCNYSSDLLRVDWAQPIPPEKLSLTAPAVLFKPLPLCWKSHRNPGKGDLNSAGASSLCCSVWELWWQRETSDGTRQVTAELQGPVLLTGPFLSNET